MKSRVQQSFIHIQDEQFTASPFTKINFLSLNLLSRWLIEHGAEDEKIDHVFVNELHDRIFYFSLFFGLITALLLCQYTLIKRLLGVFFPVDHCIN